MSLPKIASPGSAQAATRAQLRFISFVMRDQAPSADEAKAFRAGERSLRNLVEEWLGSPGYQQRIRRYFTDMFGVAADHPAVAWSYTLYQSANEGYFYRERRGTPPCTIDQTVTTEAWWLAPGETIRVCPGEVSESLTTLSGGKTITCTSDITLSVPGCGCGPKMIGCIPRSLVSALSQHIRSEFANQATLAFSQGGTWFDALASQRFFGTKLLYWKYLHSGQMAWDGILPNTQEMEQLAALSTTEWASADYPNKVIRAGLVTSPGFLMQHNNYRVRMRALSEKLLCQPIGSPLNTGGITVFLNPMFTKEDLAHAEKKDCSRCHYPMDNLGSLIFGWDTMGEWRRREDEISQIGHAFGRDGEGPRFLIQSFIERGPGFVECMARSAWEDFSGTKWEELTASDQLSLISLSAQGPKQLIDTMLRSTLLANLGIESDTPEAAPQSALPWTEVAPLIATSCSGSACHSSGSFNTTYVDHQKNVVTHGGAIAERIVAKDGKKMPPLAHQQQLTDVDIQKILKFLGR